MKFWRRQRGRSDVLRVVVTDYFKRQIRPKAYACAKQEMMLARNLEDRMSVAEIMVFRDSILNTGMEYCLDRGREI
jgi:hypothetical protein